MNEKKVLKKLEEIREKRLDHKTALDKSTEMPPSEPDIPKLPDKALTEEEIAERIEKWRETPDPTCSTCGICSPTDEKKND